VQHGFEETSLSGDFRFLGNVPVGAEDGVGVDVLSRYYDAIVFAYGAAKTRKLGIEGEELRGIHSAGDFVGWYNGLPSHKDMKFDLNGENAVVIGHGNVALDVARMLLTPTSQLAKTDITDYALSALEKSRVKNVYIVGRRGIIQAAFTVKELRELTQIPGVEFTPIIENKELQLPDGNKLTRVPKRIMQILNTEINKQRDIRYRSDQFEKRCRMIFLLSPTRFRSSKADGHVSHAEFAKQRLVEPADPNSKVVPIKEITSIPTHLVFTAIGYTSDSLAGMSDLKVDVVRGVIPNKAGRVETVSTADFGYVEADAAMREQVPGMYVSGWVKTGPTGVIATTMYSAFETGDSLVRDWNEGKEFLEPDAKVKGWDGFKKEVEQVGGKPVEWKDWKIIEAEENLRGEFVGKEREKIVDIQEMIELTEQAS
jgi:adrenodoxin-NADP+ reductase